MLLTPGPVNLHPEVLKSLALPMIHHRTPEFDNILLRVLKELKWIFQTKQDCFILNSTGSGGMECLLVNTVRPQEKVLIVNSGKFGERWVQMATAFGAHVISLEVPWGQSVAPLEIEKKLKQHPDIRAVFCQATETSSATAHPIKEIGNIVSQYSHTLFLVDGITALAAYPIPMDEWKIDGLVGGSQKAFMLPTGIALVSFSKKAWAIIDSNPSFRFYFDIRKEKEANKNKETYFSSNVTLIRAMDTVLKLIKEDGLEKHFSMIRRRAEFTRTFGLKLGFTLYSQSPSDSVTALSLPSHIDGQKFRQLLEQQYNITVMGGQDQAKGKIIRIGHMGYILDDDMINFISALGQSLNHFDPDFISLEQIETIKDDCQKWLLSQ